MSEPKTFDVQLVQRDGTSGAGKFESPEGEIPGVDWVIPVDEQGTLARVTNVWPYEPVLIRAEVLEYDLESLKEQASEIQRKAAAGEQFGVECCFCGEGVEESDAARLVVYGGIEGHSAKRFRRRDRDPSWAQMWAHKGCLEQAVRPGHRYFPWDE